MNLTVGAVVPLSLQLPDPNSSVFVQATIVDIYDAPVSGSPVNLTYGTDGNYFANSFLMPNLPFIRAIYTVYTDSGHSVPSLLYGLSSDIFELVMDNPGS